MNLPAGPVESPPTLLLLGNPNTGKTTLFNALTGDSARVGNYPGITVDRRAARLNLSAEAGRPLLAEAVDIPGAYSLSSRSPEEQIAIMALLGLHGQPRPSLVLVVLDAGQLARNLYLLVQVLELGLPVVVALNMIDEVREHPPDAARLAMRLGVPVIPTSARKGTGLPELRRQLAAMLSSPGQRPTGCVNYPEALLEDILQVEQVLPANWSSRESERRALALWALSSLGDDELKGIPSELRDCCQAVRDGAGERDLDLEIIGSRYAWIDRILPSVLGTAEPNAPKHRISERLDRVLLHPVYGFLVFTLVMMGLFQALFAGADPLIGLIEQAVSAIQTGLTHQLSPSIVRDFLVSGLVGGVGNVIVFVPQIALLFAFIALLEDSGYMSRVAFLIDRVMRSIGLHGRAFVPMLSGFACAVPAIMATRTLERKRDRLLVMMVVPLTTCSARLPVYTLIIGAVFPARRLWGWLPLQSAMMVGLYAFSLVLTLLAAWVLGRTTLRGRRVPLLLELPPYRLPSIRATLRLVLERSSDFLREAGTVILVCTVALWALLAFPRAADHNLTSPRSTTVAAAAQTTTAGPAAAVAQVTVSAATQTKVTATASVPSAIEQSYGAKLGKALEPVLAPLGFDWRLGVGLIGAFAAREVFVSTMALVYGMSAEDDVAVPLRERMREDRRPDGKPRYSGLVGLSLLVFFAIACQCMSTVAVVRRETRSWRWPLFLLGYTGILAWLLSFAVYQGGRLLGFG